jgi:hypothetical protein
MFSYEAKNFEHGAPYQLLHYKIGIDEATEKRDQDGNIIYVEKETITSICMGE